MSTDQSRTKGMLDSFYWEDRQQPPANRCILLYHKDLDLYVGSIHIGLRSRNLNLSKQRHYVSIFISKDLCLEFLSNDTLEVTKLKAEIESRRLLNLAEEEDVEFCRLGR